MPLAIQFMVWIQRLQLYFNSVISVVPKQQSGSWAAVSLKICIAWQRVNSKLGIGGILLAQSLCKNCWNFLCWATCDILQIFIAIKHLSKRIKAIQFYLMFISTWLENQLISRLSADGGKHISVCFKKTNAASIKFISTRFYRSLRQLKLWSVVSTDNCMAVAIFFLF